MTGETSGVTVTMDLPDAPLVVDGDPTRLAQVVGNLLHNAVKFTDSGGRVTVRARGEPDSATAVVSVEDTGIGMEPGVVARLFQPFAQAAQSLDRTRGGLGLGLALVKGLVELHGGSVAARSDGPGRGSTLTVRLPLAEAAVTGSGSAAPVAVTAGGLRVLLIEDNPDAAESLRMLLSLAGHQVETASDGPTGVRRVREWRPQVVLCDIGLPKGMDGYAVARALRAEPAVAPLRLVALTGYGREDDVRIAREAGFDQHLVKPAEPAALWAALGGAVPSGEKRI
jgi:CheY-like chemotaxis protein